MDEVEIDDVAAGEVVVAGVAVLPIAPGVVESKDIAVAGGRVEGAADDVVTLEGRVIPFAAACVHDNYKK